MCWARGLTGLTCFSGAVPAPVHITGAVPPLAWGVVLLSLPPSSPSFQLQSQSQRVWTGQTQGHGQDACRSELTCVGANLPPDGYSGIPVGLTLQLGTTVGPPADPEVTTGAWVLAPILSTG